MNEDYIEYYEDEDYIEYDISIEKEIKELVIEFEKSGKKIGTYFDSSFVLAVRSDNFNTDPASLDILKKSKTRLQNLILINKIEITNFYLDKMMDDELSLNKDLLRKIVNILATNLSEINSTNESEKYFDNEEYKKIFNKLYNVIKLCKKNDIELAYIIIEIDLNHEISKILNQHIAKEIRIIEKSNNIEREAFNRFSSYYLQNQIDDDNIDYVLISLMIDCYNKSSQDSLNRELESNFDKIKKSNNKVEELFNNLESKQSEVTSFNNTTKPKYINEQQRKLASLFLSGLISLGIACGVEEISYNSIQKDTKETTSTVVEYNNAKKVSILFGITCALLVATNKNIGVFGITEKFNKLKYEYECGIKQNEELINEIQEIKEEIKNELENQEEILSIINELTDELMIALNESVIKQAEIKKLLNDRKNYNL